MALEFACSPRNIFRDLKLLNDIGIPCYHDPEKDGYVIRKGFFMPPIELTLEEALTLSLLLEHIPQDGQIPFLGTARRAIDKICSQLRQDIKDDLEPLDGRMHIDLARGSGDDGAGDVYDDVRVALATRRVLECRYEAVRSLHNEPKEEVFELRPYALWYCQRGWYVVGHHSGRNDLRQLKLGRFTYTEVTDKPYQPGEKWPF